MNQYNDIGDDFVDDKPIAIPADCYDYDTLLRDAPSGTLNDIDIRPDDIATMFITSGTTGDHYSDHCILFLAHVLQLLIVDIFNRSAKGCNV